MTWNPGDIQQGMAVFGLDGVNLGNVEHVWLRSPEPDGESLSRMAHSTARGLMNVGVGDESLVTHPGYFSVEREDGPLYLPFGVVQILFPAENVTLEVTADEAVGKFAREPAALAQADTCGDHIQGLSVY